MAAKLVNQLLVGVHAQAASEALALAEDLGLTNVEGLLQLLNSAWGNSVMLQVRIPLREAQSHRPGFVCNARVNRNVGNNTCAWDETVWTASWTLRHR